MAHSHNHVHTLIAAQSSPHLFNNPSLAKIAVPNSSGAEVATFSHCVYAGQYSDDGSFFYTCTQDYQIHIYDMTKPLLKHRSFNPLNYPFGRHNTSLNLIRTFQAPPQNCRWTITDANLSPDNNWLVYSSITRFVHLVKIRGENAVLGLGLEDHEQEILDLAGSPSFSAPLGIWSLRFGADGKEIIAGGTRGKIMCYDIETKTNNLNIVGHTDDVNAVCFADRADPNVIVSGSDDGFVLVWDRRSLECGKPSGALIGHTEGITFVSPKGDGKYILSNGKDQAVKLWDLRTMVPGNVFADTPKLDLSIPDWDYRYDQYHRPEYTQHPEDGAVMTYRGHSVLQTLIRSYFSPPNTTGQRYISSASSDGLIHIWNLDGTVAQVIDRSKTVPLFLKCRTRENDVVMEFSDPIVPGHHHSNRRRRADENEEQNEEDEMDQFENDDDEEDDDDDEEFFPSSRFSYRRWTVRDISWHPDEPTLISTSWRGSRGASGSLAMHHFMAAGK